MRCRAVQQENYFEGLPLQPCQGLWKWLKPKPSRPRLQLLIPETAVFSMHQKTWLGNDVHG